MGGDAMRIAGYPLPVYPDTNSTVSQIGSRVSRKPLPAQRDPGRGSDWRRQVYPRTLRTAAINCSGVTGLASVEFAPKRFATFRNPAPKAPDIAMIFSSGSTWRMRSEEHTSELQSLRHL